MLWSRPVLSLRRPRLLLNSSFLFVFTALALGRVNGKASSSQNGTGNSKATDMTLLQMHASFLDRNKDGMVTLKETYQGTRAIGCSVPVFATGSLFINGFLSPKTRPPSGAKKVVTSLNISGIEDEANKAQIIEVRTRNISHNVWFTECGSQSIEDSNVDGQF